MNLNRIFILGNLTADPESRMLPSGQPVTNFSVATNRVWNDAQGQRQEAVEFHRVVAFGKLADVATRYLAKGRLVFVEGRVQTRSWQGRDGVKRYQTETVADGLQLGPRPASAPSPAPGPERPLVSPAISPAAAPPAPSPGQPAEDTLPVVNLEDEDTAPPTDETEEGQKIKPEDLPF